MEEKPAPKNKGVLHTYSKDLAETVKEKGGEAFRISRKEELAREETTKLSAKSSKLNRIFGILALILIVTGIVVLISVQKIKSNLSVMPIQNASIIFPNQEQPIDIAGLSKNKILEAVRGEINTPARVGEIINLPFIQKNNLLQAKLNFADFLSALKINPPESLTKFLQNDFMYGLFGEEQANQPFLLVKDTSYPDAVQGMFAWEDHLPDDLYSLLNIDITGFNAELLQAQFEDEIVKNKNVRALKNSEGEIIMLYAFLNEQTILIARDSNTLEEVLLRLYSPKKA